MKNILSKRTFIVLPLFLFSLHPLWGQKSNFKNDICIPGKLYMLSDIRNDVFVEALIKRWRPYNDFVRFSGDCVYSRKLNRVASVDTPVDGSNMKIELVNSDEFEIIKRKSNFYMRREKRNRNSGSYCSDTGGQFCQRSFFQGRVAVEELYSRYKTGRTKEYKE